ncbi:MAG TPA: hypothetical protein DCM67_07375 [Propionibacteriaceae bacterium]|nr:hypothetical protein [Propionibacteriaceae bacterium]
MKRKTVIIVAIAAAVVLSVGTGIAVSVSSGRTVVSTAKATTQAMDVTVSASGSLVPGRSSGVYPPTAGTLAKVSVHDGDAVHAGQTLATMNTAPLKLARAQAQAAYSAALAQWNVAKNSSSSARNAAASAVTATREALKQAKADADHAALKAPFAGNVIFAGTVEKGAGVQPGIAPFTVVDPAKMNFEAAVNESDIAAVKAGQTATVSLDSFTDSFPATVLRVSAAPTANTTGTVTFAVRLSIDTGSQGVLQGMSGSANIVTQSIPDALTVPIQSVITQGSGSIVYVVDANNVVHAQPVTVGGSTDTLAQIITGLSAGQTVVTTGATTVTDGQTVTIG